MKTQTAKLLLALGLVLLALLFTGCSTTTKRLEQFEALGLKEAEITGKFSSTTYKVEQVDGVRRATLDHSNAWMPKVRLVRETPHAD